MIAKTVVNIMCNKQYPNGPSCWNAVKSWHFSWINSYALHINDIPELPNSPWFPNRLPTATFVILPRLHWESLASTADCLQSLDNDYNKPQIRPKDANAWVLSLIVTARYPIQINLYCATIIHFMLCHSEGITLTHICGLMQIHKTDVLVLMIFRNDILANKTKRR